MRVWFAATAAVALIAAGCGGAGGGGGGSSDAASLVPADALAYVTVDTDLSSSQLASANGILEKFPIRAKLLRQIRSSLAQSGTNVRALESSVGPEVDIAALTVNGETNAVGFTQPKDEKAFDAQLDKDSTLHTKIDGWTVFSDKQAGIDAVKSRKANLGDD